VVDDGWVSVRDSNDSGVTAFGIEAAGEEPFRPLACSVRRPRAEVLDGADSLQRMCVDGVDDPTTDRFLEHEGPSGNHELRQVLLCAGEPFHIHQCKSELVGERSGSRPVHVRIGPRIGVSANHPAEVAAPIVRVMPRTECKCTRAHQLVVDREVRSPGPPLLRPRDVFPSPVREESVIPARDEFGPVLQGDPIEPPFESSSAPGLECERNGGTRHLVRCRRSRHQRRFRRVTSCVHRRAGSVCPRLGSTGTNGGITDMG